MSYSHIITQNYLAVMNLETGNTVKFMSDHPLFNRAIDLVRQGKGAGNFELNAALAEVEKLSLQTVIESWGSLNHDGAQVNNYKVRVVDGKVMYQFGNMPEKELHNAMTTRILDMLRDGFDAMPMFRFMGNLMANTSKIAVDELYEFLEKTTLPITDDGCFIAYKIVKDDYTSHYDNKFMNAVGTTVEMPRNEVDDNRHVTCSYGLHFCSKEYLKHYGSVATNDDRLLLVKINPADVVSIPSDYNNAKGRACKYEIWKDITEANWREKYDANDYNDSSVEEGWADLAGPDGDCPHCGSYESDIYTGDLSDFDIDQDLYEARECLDCGEIYFVPKED